MVKFILLAILVAAHASTVAFNESSVSSFAQTEEEQIEGIYPSDLNSYPTPDEPILGGFPAMLFTQESTDCEAKCNQTTAVSETFVISNEAVHVLKGVLVTRIMPSFYIFLLLISMPLNALALVTFTCRIQAKKPAVIYMSHLACVDLLFTLLLPLKIHYHLNGSDWVFGEVACRVLSAAYYCYMYCSILLMMCMSVDRLVAVVFPIASLTWRSTRNATYACVLVWLLALAGTVPLLSIKQTLKIKNVGVTCHDAILHNDAGEQLYIYLFFILSCLYFFLPLAITLISYSIIIYVLSAKSDRLPKSSSSSSADNRRRAVIMTIAVLTEFVACFALTNGILLYHCFYLAKGSHSGEVVSSYAAYMLAVCAGSSSIFLDPLLYYYGSSQCRQQIRSVFWLKKTKRATEKLDTKTKSDKV
ncbi:proteinase-activated receptor 1-like isoform X2 [Myxocyprinus asiaticus]|uniref:proteinase-activated receptor 1-like isoform X2 n=1 Tax=Myxocyprinus asiaticus TaxID=70543 RepID=UPI002223DB7F|nr:proteinase-activated receptor 1-like isoform X2 [Myxocyprinus asiaticus]